MSTAVKFDTDFSYVAPVLLYVACSNHARTPRHMYSVRSLFTRSPVRVNRASHGKRCEKIRIKLNTVPLRSFHTYFGTLYQGVVIFYDSLRYTVWQNLTNKTERLHIMESFGAIYVTRYKPHEYDGSLRFGMKPMSLSVWFHDFASQTRI